MPALPPLGKDIDRCIIELATPLLQALQHFATKFWNFTNFIMFFIAVVFDSLLFT
jgi:hypothetical protein